MVCSIEKVKSHDFSEIISPVIFVYYLCCSDFAYVARDPSTRIHRCHVFRCEIPAKQIASTLKEICTRLAKERKSKGASPEKSKRQGLNALQLVAEKGKGMYYILTLLYSTILN